MKAIVCTKYGSPDVLQLRHLNKPSPTNKEVLVRVHVASITTADSMIRAGVPLFGRLFLGLFKHKQPVPGTGFSGVVESVGEQVRSFKTGDAVFGETGLGFSANAEYVCLPEDGVLLNLPANLTHEQAAPLCDGTLTSWCFLKDIGQLQRGQRVLINGASGSLGTAAIQIAKHLGADVTGVCSAANREMVLSLGADRVIDYHVQDFTQTGQGYDLIYDTVGKSSFLRCKRVLNENGRYASPVLSLGLLFQVMRTAVMGRKKATFSATGMRPPAELRALLDELLVSIEAGVIETVIDQRYTLEQVPDAHRSIDTGHKKANLVLVFNLQDS